MLSAITLWSFVREFSPLGAYAGPATKRNVTSRLRAGLEEAQCEISLLEEELRLKDLRMERVTLCSRSRPTMRLTS